MRPTRGAANFSVVAERNEPLAARYARSVPAESTAVIACSECADRKLCMKGRLMCTVLSRILEHQAPAKEAKGRPDACQIESPSRTQAPKDPGRGAKVSARRGSSLLLSVVPRASG